MPPALLRLVILAAFLFVATFTLSTFLPFNPSEAFSTEWRDYISYKGRPASQAGGVIEGDTVLPGDQRLQDIHALRQLAHDFRLAYPTDVKHTGRVGNVDALNGLATCLEHYNCTQGQETVVVLASFHFSNTMLGGTSGEDIWANSTLEALQSLGYSIVVTHGAMDTLFIYQYIPHMIPVIIWEGKDLQACIQRSNETKATGDPESDGLWQEDTKGCIQKPGFEQGIPIWKSFAFHFWGDTRSPLGHAWTLAPVNYAAIDEKGIGNYYLGYSIETRCRAFEIPEHKTHRALALGKRDFYFDPEWKDFAWPNMLPGIIERMPNGTDENGEPNEKFEIVAGADADITRFNQGFVNLGRQAQDQWNKLVASSKVMLGVGNPYLSPSPYDALCFGTPFINPILWTADPQHPDDWTKWHTQHNELRSIGEPFVYHVMRGDAEALERALRKALTTPIDRYIPEPMTRDSVRARHKALVEGDWQEKARERMQQLADEGVFLDFTV